MQKLPAFYKTTTIHDIKYSVFCFQTVSNGEAVNEVYFAYADGSEPMRYMFGLPSMQNTVQESIELGIANLPDYI